MRDAETLLLVDDQQAKVAELHVLRQQPMRADDDVHFAGGEVGDAFLSAPALVRKRLTMSMRTGKPAKRSLQRFLVLKREHGRRREHRHLFAVHHRLEGGAHRHFGLAVADVAAQQPVHRRRRFHVALDVGDGGFLIRRQVVLEGVLEFLLPVRVGG